MTRTPNRPRPLPMGMVILYEDTELLVVDKPAGLLSMGTDSQKERTAYYFLTDYVRKGNPKSRNRVFIVHRLDKDTSGVLIFAKTEEAKQQLQGRWEEAEKRYLALVHGRPEQAEGSITSYLAENSAHVVYSTPDKTKGRFAQTDYRIIKHTPEYALLDVNLITGRKNQIRVHFAEQGFPIVGDRKYGRKKDPHKNLGLHALSITIPHPTTGEPVSCQAKVPQHFVKLVGHVDIRPHLGPDGSKPA